MGASRNAVSEICAARALYVGDDIYINRTGQQFSTKKNTAPDESVSLAATRLFMCCSCSSIEQIASCVPSLHVCGTAETVKYFFFNGLAAFDIAYFNRSVKLNVLYGPTFAFRSIIFHRFAFAEETWGLAQHRLCLSHRARILQSKRQFLEFIKRVLDPTHIRFQISIAIGFVSIGIINA